MIVNNQFPIRPMGGKEDPSIDKVPEKKDTVGSLNKGFEKILQDKIDDGKTLKFSKHAKVRLEMRNIRLTAQQNQRLDQGVKMAKEKGVRDSLILCDNLAFVVSVKNQTVVTAMNGDELKSNVFTNIDGAVIV